MRMSFDIESDGIKFHHKCIPGTACSSQVLFLKSYKFNWFDTWEQFDRVFKWHWRREFQRFAFTIPHNFKQFILLTGSGGGGTKSVRSVSVVLWREHIGTKIDLTWSCPKKGKKKRNFEKEIKKEIKNLIFPNENPHSHHHSEPRTCSERRQRSDHSGRKAGEEIRHRHILEGWSKRGLRWVQMTTNLTLFIHF